MTGAGQRRVTRDVEPAALGDLLEHPRRATVAFVRDGTSEAVPARVRVEFSRWLFAVVADAAPDLTGHEVVVVVDDGPYWFQLRGLSVRGLAEARDARDGDGLVWYAVTPRRVLAWDYGAVREE
jgi:hypothetical protein